MDVRKRDASPFFAFTNPEGHVIRSYRRKLLAQLKKGNIRRKDILSQAKFVKSFQTGKDGKLAKGILILAVRWVAIGPAGDKL
jgi:hypothetical protein